MKKGISIHSFPENMKIEECFKISRKAGYQGIELDFGKRGELTPATSKSRIKQMAKMAKNIGLELFSLNTSLLEKCTLSSPDRRIRNKAFENIRCQMDVASLLGADTILVIPGKVTEEITYEEAYQFSSEKLKRLGEKASKAGIHIGLESGWLRFLLSPIEFAKFIDEINNPYVGFYLDTANIMLDGGLPEQWIRILNKRIKKVHFKDFRRSVNLPMVSYVNLLEGDVNWLKVMQELRKVGYNDYLTVEVPPYHIIPSKCIYDSSSSLDLILSLGKNKKHKKIS